MNGNEMLYMMGNIQHLFFFKGKVFSFTKAWISFHLWAHKEMKDNDGPSSHFLFAKYYYKAIPDRKQTFLQSYILFLFYKNNIA